MNHCLTAAVLSGLAACCLNFSLPANSEAAAATTTSATSAKVASTPVANRTIATRPTFAKELPGDVNTRAIKAVKWRYREAYNTPMMAVDVDPTTISIDGPAEASQEQMVNFIKKNNPNPKLTCSVEDIVNYYYQEAGREGVRPDVALCQALKETGFFNYGGDVSPTQNNFCGLGATGNHNPGLSFKTAQEGARAHIQHLLAYSRTAKPTAAIVDPRYYLVVNNRKDIHGKVTRWTGLNGVWAVPGKNYGQEILQLWSQAQAPDASDASLAAGNKKIKEAPDEPASYIYRGIVYFNRQNYKDAAKDFSSALNYAPTSAEGLYDRALAYTALGDTSDACKDYDALLANHSNYNQAWYNRALLRLDKKDYNGVLSDLQSLLAIEERSADAQNLIGIAHLKQKKYAEAWKDFQSAAAINSANNDVLGNQFIFEACLK